MKKVIIAIVLFGMLGWTIYEFVLSSDEAVEKQEFVTEEAANKADFTDDVAKAFEADEEKEEAVEREVGLEIDQIAPDFQLTTLSGEETSLSDYRGSKVMLNFWATWCPPCRAEMPDMERFYQDTDVEILAVNLTETEATLDQVHHFADEYALNFPILLDEVIEVATIYEIQPVPTSFMIDSEGVIQFKTFGPLTYDQMVEVTADMD